MARTSRSFPGSMTVREDVAQAAGGGLLADEAVSAGATGTRTPTPSRPAPAGSGQRQSCSPGGT